MKNTKNLLSTGGLGMVDYHGYVWLYRNGSQENVSEGSVSEALSGVYAALSQKLYGTSYGGGNSTGNYSSGTIVNSKFNKKRLRCCLNRIIR